MNFGTGTCNNAGEILIAENFKLSLTNTFGTIVGKDTMRLGYGLQKGAYSNILELDTTCGLVITKIYAYGLSIKNLTENEITVVALYISNEKILSNSVIMIKSNATGSFGITSNSYLGHILIFW